MMLHHILAWALGAIGLGGIAAVLVFIPGASAVALKVFGTAVSFISRYPWQAALAAALALAGWNYLDARSWHKTADHNHALFVEQKRQLNVALAEWKHQAAQVKAAREKAEKDAKEASSHAQSVHDALLADNHGLRDYIAAHRVRGGQTAVSVNAPGPDRDAQVPANTSTPTAVEIDQSVLDTCDADYIYAFGAYTLMQDLKAKGRAVDSP